MEENVGWYGIYAIPSEIIPTVSIMNQYNQSYRVNVLTAHLGLIMSLLIMTIKVIMAHMQYHILQIKWITTPFY